jgi:hypothetical protein
MEKKKRLRLAGMEVLEDRRVPSGFDGGGIGGLIGSLPAADARAVAKAFETFEQSYYKDVTTILAPAGTTNPASNRAAFDAQVGTDLMTLNSAIDTAIANLPTASTLDTTIQAELLTSATPPTTPPLQTQLSGIASPTSAMGRSIRMFLFQSFRDIDKTSFQVTQQVRSAPAPAGTIDATTVENLLSSISSAFETFGQTYSTDVKTILFASTGTPASNRAAFDTAVGTALQTLQSSVTSSLSTSLSSFATFPLSTLTTTVQNDLTGTQTTPPKSLQTNLAALKTPGSTGFFARFLFQARSFGTIGNGEYQVFHDILSAVKTYNMSL